MLLPRSSSERTEGSARARPRGGSLPALLLAVVLQPGDSGGCLPSGGAQGLGGRTGGLTAIYPEKQLRPFNLLGGGKQVCSNFHGIFDQLRLGVGGRFLLDFMCFSIGPHYRSVNKFNEVK